MPDYDVAVIGGGPAGSHAALKTALLYRSAVLFDKGRKHSRIFWSPRVDNIPGRFGESGRSIVDKGFAAIAEYEADIDRSFVTVHQDTQVTKVTRLGDEYQLEAEGKTGPVTVTTKVVVVATGCVDRQPQLRDFRRRDIEAVLPYANKGLADYCLICDGHTVEGKKVAVLGCDPGSRQIAKSLKTNFGADTHIVPYCNVRDEGLEGPANPIDSWESVEADLAKWEIPIHYGHIANLTGIKEGKFGIVFEDGRQEQFDKAWISMGWYKVNNEPAVDVGGQLDANGFVVTDGDGRVLDSSGKAIPGFYCIGDVRADTWKQIPIAWGHAEAAIIDAFVSNRRSQKVA